VTEDGLTPPGEQLELFPDPGVTETVVHRAGVFGNGVTWWWSCACGRAGPPTTEGRAHGGRRVHMRAARKRAARSPDRP